MKRNGLKSTEWRFHLYIDHINGELKSYLPYISAVLHSSKAVLLPSGALQYKQARDTAGAGADFAQSGLGRKELTNSYDCCPRGQQERPRRCCINTTRPAARNPSNE
jgi:hypothetical protein